MLINSFILYETNQTNFSVELHQYENGKSLYYNIESDRYKGHGPIYLLKDDISNYIEKLNHMSQTLTGACLINDSESDSFIQIFFRGMELFVKGKVSDYSVHALSFEFRADQTLLIPFMKVLEQLL